MHVHVFIIINTVVGDTTQPGVPGVDTPDLKSTGYYRTSMFITKISVYFPQNTFMSFVRASRFPEKYIVALLVAVAAMTAYICFYGSHEFSLSLHRCLYHSRNYE